MCLLLVAFGLDPEAPLLVGANRDERLDRPATAMTVLRERRPRILGGRDELAGGTWLAVNEHGLVAGLTNRPLPDGRDPAKKSRGELPLALASHRTASEAVDDFVRTVSPAHYNPAWFLVGDRDSLFSIDLTNGPTPGATALGPGLYILENSPLGAPSPKVTSVGALVGHSSSLIGPRALETLRRVLADHTLPPPTDLAASGSSAPSGRRPETLAACVHTDDYGTRSSTLIRLPADRTSPPEVFYSDGPPCRSPFLEATGLWTTSNEEPTNGKPRERGTA